MSFHILNTGSSALTAAQRAVETAAHNAANSTSPGYTRQRVAQTASVPAQGAGGIPGSGHRGTGVQVVAIERLRDVLADLAVRAEASTAGATQVRAEVMDRAQGILGVYGSGVSDSLSKLFAAFDQLALTPDAPAARQIVIEAGQAFASGLNNAASTLGRIRSDATLQAESEVAEVNDVAAEIAELNKHIVAANNGGQNPNDLLDRRDVLLDRLATLAGARVRQRADGAVDVSIGQSPLVQASVAFRVQLTSTMAGGAGSGGDLHLAMHDLPVTLGGQLGGRVEVVNTELRLIEAELDEVARAVAKAVNGVHAQGYYGQGGTGQLFFHSGYDPESGAPASYDRVTAAGLRLHSGLSVDTLAAAANGTATHPYSSFDGENALALARLRSSKVWLGDTVTAPDGSSVRVEHTPADWLNGVTSTLASRASAALAAAETARIAHTAVSAQRESANGVSIDEEMIELVKFQHSYDAAARVISIADEMLNTLINRMGAGR